MTLAILGYFTVTLATLLALARMILHVGRAIEGCAQTGAAARGAGLAIASGFVAIGLGGIILLAAGIPAFAHSANAAELAVVTLLTVGLACLTLGLGFAHALGNLRSIVQPPKPLPMEPVLG
ncbi:MAG: hypothetical protein MUD11_03660 [Rhodobacteraceae bacterium]|jgi:hypothetical protein|nr:hypothetical protein [Paracoccaceae bacterium]